uniref:BHLH domain-containing protein n=1 Tax=Leersia perrieri TaxID=77586 RepID=A0A0D9VYT4_9ORYZ
MQMESYYGAFHDEAAFFFPHHGVMAPASPELPFGLIASPEPSPPPPSETRHGAFQDYAGAMPVMGGGGGTNIHRRVLDVLGRMGTAGAGAAVAGERGIEEEEEEEEPRRRRGNGQGGDVESSRGFRHMMRERQRREKLSQSYADLYAMVSSRSKGDKNSIVQSAAIYIHELKGARDQLQRRNEELKAKIMGHDEQQQCVKVQFEVDQPTSSIDSMIGALRRLKSMNVKARGIRSSLSGNRLRTEMNVETTIAASEVERAVEEALNEVGRNQLDSDAPFPGSRGWTQTSHVQNVF